MIATQAMAIDFCWIFFGSQVTLAWLIVFLAYPSTLVVGERLHTCCRQHLSESSFDRFVIATFLGSSWISKKHSKSSSCFFQLLRNSQNVPAAKSSTLFEEFLRPGAAFWRRTASPRAGSRWLNRRSGRAPRLGRSARLGEK